MNSKKILPENSRYGVEFKASDYSTKNLRYILGMEKFRAILSLILSLTIFIGGIFLTVSQVKIWNILIGVPATIIGVAFIVISFDNLNQLSLEDDL